MDKFNFVMQEIDKRIGKLIIYIEDEKKIDYNYRDYNLIKTLEVRLNEYESLKAYIEHYTGAKNEV